jgi:hypothetical protein
VLLAWWERVPCQGVRPGRAELVEVGVLLARSEAVASQGIQLDQVDWVRALSLQAVRKKAAR